ncbi:MAG: WD40 repeat domain-containing protein [Anaerolineales bacterium]|nr:WD40 repeat domain-containing protein [Anaerolineales bacterium]
MNKYGVLVLSVVMWLTACTDLAEPNAVESSSVTVYPSPESSPTPASSIGWSLAPVASGQGVEEAAVFDPDKDAPYRFLILDTSGEIHPWNVQLPSTWKPGLVSDTELVIVIAEQLKPLNSQQYTDGGTITRYQHVVTATIREARTGFTVAEKSFIGAEPGPFPSTRFTQTQLVGTRIDFQDLSEWLNTEAAQVLKIYQPPVHVFRHNSHFVQVVAFSPDGQIMATGTNWGEVFLWRVEDGALLNQIAGYGNGISVDALAFSPDRRQLVSGGSNGILKIWDVSTGDLIATVDEIGRNIRFFSQIIFSPDSQLIVAVAGNAGGQSVYVVRGSDFEPLTSVGGSRAAFSKDGMTLFVYNNEFMNTFQINAEEVSFISRVEFYPWLGLPVFSPEMDMMASRGPDGELTFWRVSDGQKLQTLGEQSQDIVSIAFSPDGLLLATGFPDGTVSIWRVSDGEILTTLIGQLREVRSIAFSLDGKFLASGSIDGTVRMWSLEEILEE